ncbi:phospholipid phosphatase 5-like [Littorina saxatilis]|uniref:Phosphatidic acid phosphatase type 2/haloperoxidase domain-containing protein n=1 Tax=Littorina saxatilis TaxID=31220 RepID=A0AAN9BS14_9CAEN
MRNKKLSGEIALRFILFVIFTITDDANPYHRAVQPEELWLYRYPHTPDFYPGKLMWITVFSVPTAVFVGFYIIRRNSEDLIQATLGVTLSIYITGCVTNFVKLAVGRPRPDFLSRCYPEGPPEHISLKDNWQWDCSETANPQLLTNGLKSFPSGHASLSFASLGYVSLYLAGKLQVFNRGRGQGWRFVGSIIPVIWALMIAVSRTSDFHHHWQDVTVGGIIGLVVCYFCYRQVYPSLDKMNSYLCYSLIPRELERSASATELSSPRPKAQETEFNFISRII